MRAQSRFCGLYALATLVLAACAPQPRLPAPTATALPRSVEIPTATAPALPVPSPTPPLPTPSPTLPLPTPSPTIPAGPLTVEGQPLRAFSLATDGSLCYGVSDQGLWRSENGGRTWQQVSDLALPEAPLVSQRNPRTLLSGGPPSCYRGDGNPALRRSYDGGATWQETAGARGIQPVAEHPGDGQIVYGISCAGLHLSRDGGETWQLTGPTLGWTVTSIIRTGSGRPLLLAVLTSEGGSSRLAWFDEQGQLIQDPIPGLEFWGTAALASDGGNLYAATSRGVWRCTDGATWTLHREGLAEVTIEVDPLQEAVPQEAFDRGFGLFALAIDPRDPQRLALGTVRGLYLSRDRGASWQPAPGAEPLAGLRINALTWDPQEEGALYVTTAQGVWRIVIRNA